MFDVVDEMGDVVVTLAISCRRQADITGETP